MSLEYQEEIKEEKNIKQIKAQSRIVGLQKKIKKEKRKKKKRRKTTKLRIRKSKEKAKKRLK